MRPRAESWSDCEGHRRWKRAGCTLFRNGFGHWLPTTALKTPISVYLTLVPCAISTSLTSSCSLAFIVDDFPRLPILSKLRLYHEVHKSLGKRIRQLRAPSLLDSSGFVPLLLLPAPRQAGRDCSALSALFSYSLLCALLRGR